MPECEHQDDIVLWHVLVEGDVARTRPRNHQLSLALLHCPANQGMTLQDRERIIDEKDGCGRFACVVGGEKLEQPV